MKCFHCQGEILPGERAQPMPPPMVAMIGPKSGRVVLVVDTTFSQTETYHIHWGCLAAFCDPEHNPHIYDEITARIRAEIEEEIFEVAREEFREKLRELRKKVADEDLNFCMDCGDDVDPYEDVMCPWCKRTEKIWTQHRPEGQGPIFYCGNCGKCWDENEEELAAA